MYDTVYTNTPHFNRLMDDIRNNHNPGILCGSAISIFSPTCIEPGMKTTSNLATGICRSAGLRAPMFSDIIKRSAYEAVLGLYPREVEIEKILSNYFLHHGRAQSLSKSLVEPNSSHSAAAKLLDLGQIKGIVTTNYDTCFETAYQTLSGKPANLIINRERGRTPDFDKAIYKIHGCASKGNMIYRIEQEGTMPKWKQDYFQHTVGDTIVIMGYSGQDFDICPVLARLRLERVFWIALNNGSGPELTPQAEAVLEKHGAVATIICGDMRDVLSAWTGTKISRDVCPSSPLLSKNLIDAISESEGRLWAAKLFGLFGIPAASAAAIHKERISLPSGVELSIDFQDAELNVLSHSGRYYDHMDQSVKLASKVEVSLPKRINLTIGEAGSASMAADYNRAKSALARAEKLCSGLKAPSDISQMRSSIRWMHLVIAGDELDLHDNVAVENHFSELKSHRIKAERDGNYGMADNCRERISTILKRRGIPTTNAEGDSSGKLMLQMGVDVGYWTALKTQAERTGSQDLASKLRSGITKIRRYGRFVTLWRAYKLLIHFEPEKKKRNLLFRSYKRAMARCQFHKDYVDAMDREAKEAVLRPKFVRS